jgi:hypothetical protein
MIWNGPSSAMYANGTKTLASSLGFSAIQAVDGATTYIANPIDASLWAGRTVKIKAIILVSGVSAGNIGLRSGIWYRTTALNGVLTTSYNGGGSDGSAGITTITGVAAPTASGAALEIETASFSIPSNITAASLNFLLERNNAADTNTDTLTLIQISLVEQ